MPAPLRNNEERWEKEDPPFPTQLDDEEEGQRPLPKLHLTPPEQRVRVKLTAIHLPGIDNRGGTHLVYSRIAEAVPGTKVSDLIRQKEDWSALIQPIRAANLLGCAVGLGTDVEPGQEILLAEQSKYQDPTCPKQGSSRARSGTPPNLQGLCREDAARLQQAWVANDEMDYYHQVLGDSTRTQAWEALTAQTQLPKWLAPQAKTTEDTLRVASAVLVGKHWEPWLRIETETGTQLYTGAGAAGGTQQLGQRIKDQLPDYGHAATVIDIPHQFNADCGFQVIG